MALDTLIPSSYCIILTLLNVRGLKSHLVDIECDLQLVNSDVLLLTETQYQTDQNNLPSHILDLELHHHLSENKFDSVSVAVKSDVIVVEKRGLLGSFCITFTKVSIKKSLTVLLLYRRQSFKMSDFLYLIRHWLSHMDGNIDIILGDFNINHFSSNGELETVLNHYTMLVDFPTHIAGSCLDHVYVHNKYCNKCKILEKCVYFSDHDAVKLLVDFQDLMEQ